MKKVGDRIKIYSKEDGHSLIGIIEHISYDLIKVKSVIAIHIFDTLYGESDNYYIDSLEVDIPENPFKYLKNKMENEGFHYCFNGYSDWKDIEDTEFQILKNKYLEVAKNLEKYIEEKAVLGMY